MPLRLDHQLRERMEHDAAAFPLSYFDDELADLPHRAVPLHWHPEFEFVTVVRETLAFQIGLEQLALQGGESIFINRNVLHGMRQEGGEEADPMPNIVFLDSMIAPESSRIHQKYVQPILRCDGLSYVIFRREIPWQAEINSLLGEVYRCARERGDCYEMAVQRGLSRVFEQIYLRLDTLPRQSASRMQITAQARIQQMQAYIHAHYAQRVTLDDVAAAANVSRSEANRCFNAYMGCSPIEALTRYRLSMARRLLAETALPLREISARCGFNSESYFYRCFRRIYGCSPASGRKLGK